MKATPQPFRTYFVIGLLASAMILCAFTLTGLAQTPTVGMGSSTAQSQQLAGGFTLTGSMTTARKGHTATLQPDGRVLIVGGNSGSVASAELFDPLTGTFSATGSLSRAVVNHRATLLPDGRTLITDASGHAELYNPVTSTFTVTGSMIVARVHTATLLMSGKVLFTGNASVSELYDPLTGTFTATGSTLDGSISTGSWQRTDAAILLLDGRVLRTGYYHTEIYDPQTGTFSVVGPPPIYNLVQDSTITLLASGSVLFTGGVNPINCDTITFDSGVLYVPETGNFQPTDNLNVSRAFHTATLLPGGTVLITGGFSGGYCCFPDTRSAEIYVPDSGTFLPESSMVYERSGHTATLLRDGRVLVAGGGSSTAAQASAELYVPGNTSTLKASFLGVTGQDYVGPASQVSPNGIADWHIQLQGLRGTPIKVEITSNTGGIWQTPYNGYNWIILAQYGGSGTGDLWFEPWPSQSFHVKVWYFDATTAEADATNNATLFRTFYLGVTGGDYVGPDNQMSPNGIADWHIQLQGLRGTPVKVEITNNTGGIWQTPYNGYNWIILAQYGGSGTGDLWFEPWPSQSFHVKVWYADASTDEADATNNATLFRAFYLGVTGEDYVGPDNQVSPNGIADWHIQLQGLRGTPIKVEITSNTGGIWQTPYNGNNWIILEQDGGSGTGDLWYEPWPSQSFHVKVWYADATTDEADATNSATRRSP